MAKTKFRLAGADELIKKMNELSDKGIISAVRRGMKSSIPDMYFQVVSRVPVDTGELKSKMETYGPKINKRKGFIHGGVQTPSRQALGIDPKDPNYWPAALEYGSKAHTIKRRGKGVLGFVMRKSVNHPGQPPVAFLRNGMEASKNDFESNTIREINKELKKATKARAKAEKAGA